jgi:peptidyl-prolyl cis-trans isomerase SurA
MATIAFAAACVWASASHAQVVVVANGSPITELDIQQRMKLTELATHKKPSREETVQELIDDRLKLAKAKAYSFEVEDKDVDNAFNNMAQRQHITPQQFTQVLERSGIMPSTVKARIKAEITWNQLVRGRYSSTLQVGETDISNALRERNETEATTVGYIYTLYPIVIVASGREEANSEAKHREAENLRARFLNCNEGLPLARALRNVAVREPISRNSSDLAPALRDLLGSMEIGRLTAPEVTDQGLQMFAVCAKKQSAEDTPVKREVRDQLFAKRFDAESKKFLREIRSQAMIEYK